MPLPIGRMTLFLVILGVFVLILTASRPTHIEKPPQDLAAEVADLKLKVEKLTLENATLTSKIRTHEAVLADVFVFFRALPKACEALDKKMDEARQNGFEKAGPNPLSKTDVLDGIKHFTIALRAADPTRPTTNDPK